MPKNIRTSHLVKLSLPDILIYFLGCPPPLWGQGSFPSHSLSSQLVPSHSPHSLLLPLTPSHSCLTPLAPLAPLAPLTPSQFSLTPLAPISFLAPTEVVGTSRNSIICYYPSLTIGSKGEWGEQEEGVRGARGSKGSERGARGNKGSKKNVILGFKAPTTIAGKKFSDHL